MRRMDDTEPSAGAVDGGGFTRLFRAEYPSIVGLIIVVVGDRAVAEDLTQDAFRKAHQRWDRLAGYERPGA